MIPKLKAAVPLLRSFGEAKAKEFYVGFLGFTIDWEHRFEPDMPLFMQMSLGDCVIHLSEHHGDASPGATLRIECDNPEEYCTVLNDKKYQNAHPEIKQMDWGKDMAIADGFGNKLIFLRLE